MKIDLSKADVTVNLGTDFTGAIDLSTKFTADASDTISGAFTTATSFVGTAGNENINFASGNANITKIDGGEGTDTITLGSGGGDINYSELKSITNVEKIILDNSSHTVTLNAAALSGLSGAELSFSEFVFFVFFFLYL